MFRLIKILFVVFPVMLFGLFCFAGNANAAWYNASWPYRKQITIPSTGVSGTSTLLNFPVLINLASDSNLSASAQATGYDILFTASDSVSKLNHEIEAYASTSGQLAAWVNVPQLNSASQSTSTVIYMYYGNAGAGDQQNATSTWDSNYMAVWHLNNSTGSLGADSTINGNNVSSSGATTPTATSSGKIAGAFVYNSAEYDNSALDNNATLNNSSFTLQAWAYRTGASSAVGGAGIAGKWNANQGYFLWLQPSTELVSMPVNGTPHMSSDIASPLNDWQFIVGTFNGDSASVSSIYVNGVFATSAADSLIHPSTQFEIGRYGDAINKTLEGIIDEVRLSRIVRSSDWIATEYANQSTPSSFIILGSQTASTTNRTVTWDGGSSTANWLDAGNWDVNEVPTTSDDVVIGNYSVTLAGSTTINSLSYGGTVAPVALTINSGVVLTVNATTTLVTGYINTGTLNAKGNIVSGTAMYGGTGIIDFGNDSLAQTWTLNGGISPNFRLDSAADASDSVVFNAASTLYGATITSSFVGAIPFSNSSNYEITISSGGWKQAAGTFTQGNWNFTVAGEASISGGTFTGSSATTSFGSNVTITASSTFTAASSTYLYGCHSTLDLPTTLTFHNMAINKSGCIQNLGTGDTAVITGELQLIDGVINVGTFDARANILTASTFDGGPGFIDFGNDSLAQTWTLKGGTSPIVRLNSAADASDTILFNATSTLYGATITPSFVGVIPISNSSNYEVTIGYGGWYQAAGFYTQGSFNFTDAGEFTILDGAFTGSSATTSFGSNVTITASSTFTAASSTYLYGCHSTLDVPTTLTFNIVTINKSGCQQNFGVGDTIVIIGTLYMVDGINLNGTIDIRGNVVVSSTYDGGTTILDFGNDSLAQTITMYGGILPVLRLDSAADASDSVVFNATSSLYGATITPSFIGNIPFSNPSNYTIGINVGGWYQATGTFTQGNWDFTNAGDFVLSGGIFNGSSASTSYSGNFTISGGTYNAASTTNFKGGCHVTINVLSRQDFYDFKVDKSGCQFWIGSGDILAVHGDLYLIDGVTYVGTYEVEGDLTVISTFDAGSSALIIATGSADQIFNFTGAAALYDGDIQINKTGGAVNLVSALTLDASNQDMTLVEGTFDLNGNNLTVGSGGTLTIQNGATLRLQGSETITANSGFPLFTSDSTVYYDGTSSTYALKDYTYGNLTINGPGGTFNASSGTLTIIGDFSHATGSFNASTGSVLFAGTIQTISGNTVFYNFSKIVSDLNSNSLISYWKFDDGAGTTSTDSSGNSRDGILINSESTDWTSTSTAPLQFQNDYALSFDTNNEYVSVSGGGGLNAATSGTISMWVKWIGTQDQGYSGYGHVLARQSDGDFSNNIIGLTTSDPDTAKITWAPYTYTTAITSITSPGNGVWHHILVTFSSGSHALYIDGEIEGTSAATGAMNDNSAIPLTIGAWISGGAGYSTSHIDDVRIYNTVLNDQEIYYLANGYDSLASGSTLSFASGSTQTITGTMTLQGASSAPLYLRSTASGSQWYIDPQATRTIAYLDVKDSNNINATAINAINSTSTDSGNNTNWTFEESTSSPPAATSSVVQTHYRWINDNGAEFSDGLHWTQATDSAPWTERVYAGAVVYNNKMWIVGGSPSTNDVWYSTDGISWTLATDSAAWSTRSAFGMLVYDNKMWILGGASGTTYYNDVWYSTDGITWTQATSGANWSKRTGHGSVVFNNKMWVIGGNDNNTAGGCPSTTTKCSDAWYSTDGITWTQATSDAGWIPRSSHETFVYDNKMWVVTGASTSALEDSWYSTDGTIWTQATSDAGMGAKSASMETAYNNKMWIMGGNEAGLTRIDSVWSSTDGANWTKETNEPEWPDRRAGNALVYNNKMWLLGGWDGANLNDVWYSSSPTSSTFAAAEDTAASGSTSSVYRLRIQIQGSTSTTSVSSFKLYYAPKTNNSCATSSTLLDSYTALPSVEGSEDWFLATSSYITSTTSNGQILNATNFPSWGGDYYLGTTTSAYVFSPNTTSTTFNFGLASTSPFTEVGWVLKSTSTASGSYCFVAKESTGANLNYTAVAEMQLPGSPTAESPVLTQLHYRWRNNDGNETGATFATGTDDSLSDIYKRTPYRLRISVQNTGGDSTSSRFSLQYSPLDSTCASSSGWTYLVNTGYQGYQHWSLVNVSNVSHLSSTTDVSINSGIDNNGMTFASGQFLSDSNLTSIIALSANYVSELEYSLWAENPASNGGSYCFRLADLGSGLTITYSVYPQISLSANPPSRGMGGSPFEGSAPWVANATGGDDHSGDLEGNIQDEPVPPENVADPNPTHGGATGGAP